MGGDITNVKNSNMKVPPLKIVLSSATSGGSDRSSSTSPPSDSESLDSNLTIVSENHQQHQQERSKKSGEQTNKDTPNDNKPDKSGKQAIRNSSSVGVNSSHDQKATSNNNSSTIATGNTRRSNDDSPDTSTTNNNNDPTANREQTANSNQRITRSSQRAAQQNKSESNETNCDETNVVETQDTSKSINELGQRKVKRRKGEVQESEQDNNQQVPQQPVLMANICPADYQLPLKNSFELYRDIRNQPHARLMKLKLLQPRMPKGFSDYLLHSGPYLLDGNKVGAGICGSKMETSTLSDNLQNRTNRMSNCVPTVKVEPALNLKHKLLKDQSSSQQQQKNTSYTIPTRLKTPRHLNPESPLIQLFQDQEEARHKMRMQHLKERERAILSAEQEILRAYNRVTTADTRQPSHLSACTYFYHQERYHYIDEKSNYLDSINHKNTRESSDSCNAENNDFFQTDGSTNKPAINESLPSTNQDRVISSPSDTIRERKNSQPDDVNQPDSNGTSDFKPPAKKRKGNPDGNDDKEAVNGSGNGCDTDEDNKVAVQPSTFDGCNKQGDSAIETSNSDLTAIKAMSTPQDKKSAEELQQQQTDDSQDKPLGEPSEAILAADIAELSKTNLINSLHNIDEKWAEIREAMYVRHKNESDSLYAVQCLEWEWKAKEIGACDIRLSLRIDSESIPRVEVTSHDY